MKRSIWENLSSPQLVQCSVNTCEDRMWDMLCGHSLFSLLWLCAFCWQFPCLSSWSQSCFIPPPANEHGNQTHRAKILPWFGSRHHWPLFPAFPQPLCGFLCLWTPTALPDLRTALWTSYIPSSKGLPFPPNDSWTTWIEAFSSRRLPKTLGMLEKRVKVI